MICELEEDAAQVAGHSGDAYQDEEASYHSGTSLVMCSSVGLVDLDGADRLNPSEAR